MPSLTMVYCDNLSALHLTTSPVLNSKSKHIAIDYHFVREKVAVGAVITKHVPSEFQVADIFTKALSKKRHFDLRLKLELGVSPATSLPKKGHFDLRLKLGLGVSPAKNLRGIVDLSDMSRFLGQGNLCFGSNRSVQTIEGMMATVTSSSSLCNEEMFGPKSLRSTNDAETCELGFSKPNAKRNPRAHDGDKGKKRILAEGNAGRTIRKS